MVDELCLFGAKAFPLLILLMSHIWHSSSRSFNVFSFDAVWAENWIYNLPNDGRMRYKLCHISLLPNYIYDKLAPSDKAFIVMRSISYLSFYWFSLLFFFRSFMWSYGNLDFFTTSACWLCYQRHMYIYKKNYCKSIILITPGHLFIRTLCPYVTWFFSLSFLWRLSALFANKTQTLKHFFAKLRNVFGVVTTVTIKCNNI